LIQIFTPTFKSPNTQTTILARPLRERLTRPPTVRRDTERVTEKGLETIAQRSFGIIWTRPLVGDRDIGGATTLLGITITGKVGIVMGVRVFVDYDLCASKC
jgi:hypothetical protein